MEKENVEEPKPTTTEGSNLWVEEENKKDKGCWIFGYGSLAWRPGFEYDHKKNGYIKGYRRRLWQGSEDHRGTPGKPGRVATLVKDETKEEKTWGVAYFIREEDQDKVFAYLDFREKGGFIKETVPLFLNESSEDTQNILKAIIYRATEENELYLGDAPIEKLALQIYESSGPSGPNIDYLVNLAEAMRQMGVDDLHLFEIEQYIINNLKKKEM